MSRLESVGALGSSWVQDEMQAKPRKKSGLPGLFRSIRNRGGDLLKWSRGSKRSPPATCGPRTSIATLLTAKAAVNGHVGSAQIAGAMNDALLRAWGEGASLEACTRTLARIAATPEVSQEFKAEMETLLSEMPSAAESAAELGNDYLQTFAGCHADGLLLAADELMSPVARDIRQSIQNHFAECRHQDLLVDELASYIWTERTTWTNIAPEAERFCRNPSPTTLGALIRGKGPRHVASRILLEKAYQTVVGRLRRSEVDLRRSEVDAFEVAWDSVREDDSGMLANDIALVLVAATAYANGHSPVEAYAHAVRGRSMSLGDFMQLSELTHAGTKRAFDQTAEIFALKATRSTSTAQARRGVDSLTLRATL